MKYARITFAVALSIVGYPHGVNCAVNQIICTFDVPTTPVFEFEESVESDSRIFAINYHPANAAISSFSISGQLGDYYKDRFEYRLSRIGTATGILELYVNDSLALPPYPSQITRTTLRVQALCNGTPYPIAILQIKAINGFAPWFYGLPYGINISEAILVGASVDTPILAIDWDPSPAFTVSYALTGGNEDGTFALEQSQNVALSPQNVPKEVNWLSNEVLTAAQLPRVVRLRVLKPLDYDAGIKSFVLNVTASDNGGANADQLPKTNWTLLRVNVLDVDDLPPVFDSKIYHGLIRQDAVAGTSLSMTDPIRAQDGDTEAKSVVKYSIENDRWIAHYFKIDADTGAISLQQALPSNSTNELDLMIKAEEIDNPAQYANAFVHVTVTPQHDPQCTVNASFPSNLTSGTVVGRVSFGDQDQLGTFSYELINSSAAEPFSLGAQTGLLSVIKPNNLKKTANWTIQAITKSTTESKIPCPITTINVHLLDRIESNNTTIGFPVSVHSFTTLGTVTPGVLGFMATRKNVGSSDSPDWVISVADKSDNAPVMISDGHSHKRDQGIEHFEFKINKTWPVGAVVGKVYANDNDGGEAGKIRFAPLQFPRYFRLSDDGSITLNESLPDKANALYHIVFQARDQSSEKAKRRFTLGMAQIQVADAIARDEDLSSPRIINLPNVVAISESLPAGAVIYSLKISVPPTPEQQLSIISGNINNTFSITGTSVIIARPLRAEVISLFELRIQLTINGQVRSNDVLTVQILDLNDNRPIFEHATYEFYLNSSSITPNYIVGTVKAHDADLSAPNNEIFYELEGDGFGVFTVDGNTGHILALAPARRYYSDTYRLSIVARDRGQPSLRDTAIVTIHLLDVGTPPTKPPPTIESPQFTQLQYSITILENAPATNLIRVSASHSQFRVRYSLINDVALFKINADTGQMSTTGPLDYEQSPEHRLNVSACLVWNSTVSPLPTTRSPISDLLDGTELCSFATVFVLVLDENDNPPVFDQSIYTAKLPQDAVIGSLVVRVHASDNDSDSNGDVSYALTSDTSVFAIDYATGWIRTVSSNLNPTVYELVVEAFDHGRPTLKGQARVQIIVNGTNPHAPEFERFVYDATILENATNGTTVIRVVAVDPDPGDQGRITYVLPPAAEPQPFVIDPNTGEIKVAGKLDYESKQTYQLIVEAVDHAQFVRTGTTLVRIVVKDVDDNAPIFDPLPDRIFVSSSKSPSMAVFRVRATDRDSAASGGGIDTVKYSVEPPSSYFGFDNDELIVKNRLEPGEYNITLVARDGGGLSSNHTLTIIVMTDSLLYPVFPQLSYEITIKRNETLPKVIETFRAVVKQGKIKYAMIPNNITGLTFDENLGILSATPALIDNRTVDVPIFLIIRATNTQDSNYFSDAELMITITYHSGPRVPLMFPLSLYRGTIPENEPADTNTNVTISVVDAETFDKLNYWLSPNDSFTVDSSGRIFTVKPINSESLPPSANGLISLQAFASTETSVVSTIVQIKITDVNEFAPRFGQAVYTVKVSEAIPSGEVIARLQATDEDYNDRLLRYRIVNPDAAHYVSISPEGVLTKSDGSPFDRETNKTINVTVEVSDQKGLTATTVVIIELVDVNDNPPQFVGLPYMWNVTEGPTGLGQRFVVSAVDLDEGVNGELSFRILQGNADGYFLMGPTNGTKAELSVIKPLDREEKSQFLLIIEVRDHGTPSLFSVATVTINVMDINDNPPKFFKPNYEQSISADFPLGFPIVSVYAQDLDLNSNLTYSMASSGENDSASSYFTIRADNGQISLIRPLPLANHTYGFTAVVSDGLFTDKTNVTIDVVWTKGRVISVINVTFLPPRIPPQFDHESYNFSVPENVENATVGKVGLVDIRNPNASNYGAVTLSIEPEIYRQHFRIDANTGIIYTTRKLSPNSKDLYVPVTFFVSATDKSDPPLKTYVPITVYIIDENDHIPEFSQTEYVGLVPATEKANYTIVLDIRATDEDVGLNAKIRYTITGSDAGCFAIDPDTAIMTLTCNPDYYTKNIYSLLVVATDRYGEGNSATATVTILVVPPIDVVTEFPTPIVWTVRTEISTSSTSRLATATTRGAVSSAPSNISTSSTRPATVIGPSGLPISGTSQTDIVSELPSPPASSFPNATAFPVRPTNSTNANSVASQSNFISSVTASNFLTQSIPNFSTGSPTANSSNVTPNQPITVTPVTALISVPPISGTPTSGAPIFGTSTTGPVNLTSSPTITISSVGLISGPTAPAFPNATTSSTLLPIFGSSAPGPTIGLPNSTANTPVSRNSLPFSFPGSLSTTTGPIISPVSATAQLLTPSSTPSISGQSTNPATASTFSGSSQVASGSTGFQVVTNQPICQQLSFSFDVDDIVLSERAPIGSPVYVASAKPKSTDRNVACYPIYGISGSGSAYFSLNPDSGLLKIAQSFDVNAMGAQGLFSNSPFPNTLVLNLTASLPDVGFTARSQLRVRIERVNESVPLGDGEVRFERRSYSFRIREQEPAGSLVGEVKAVANQTSATLTYTVLSAFDAFRFADPNNGTIVTRTVLNYDDPIKSYSFVIQASDGIKNDYATVVVDVIDINNHPPTFAKSIYNFSIPEGPYLQGAIVGDVEATDMDSGVNALINYTVAETDVPFRMESNGRLYVFGTIDREQRSFYVFHVQATDNGIPPLSSNVTVNVTIVDVNDNSPVFDNFTDVVQVPDGTSALSVIAQVKAHDDDAGLNGHVTYRLLSATDVFIIDQDGIIRNVVPVSAQKQKEYVLTIQASDLGRPSRSTLRNMTIVVEGTISGPHFPQDIVYQDVSSNVSVGTPFLRMSAGNGSLTYAIAGGNENGLFTINRTTGDISFQSTPPSGGYTLTITATNTTSNRTATASARIYVYAQNGSTSQTRAFDQRVYTVDWPENSPAPAEIIHIQSIYEQKHQPVHYGIAKGDQGKFRIDPDVGIVYVLDRLDRENQSMYIMVIRARPVTRRVARQGDFLSSIYQLDPDEAILIVNVTDVNDNSPSFVGLPFTFTAPPGAGVNQLIGAVKAVDPDISSTVHYGIISGNDDATAFRIDPNSGQIFTAANLDSIDKMIFTISVNASDGTFTTNATVQIFKAASDNEVSLIARDRPLEYATQLNQTLAKRLSDLTGWTVSVTRMTELPSEGNSESASTQIFLSAFDRNHSLSVDRDTFSRKLLAILPTVQNDDQLKSLQLEYVGEPTRPAKTVQVISGPEIALIVISGIVILLALLGVLFLLRWWNKREKQKVNAEYMLESNAHGKRPYEAETLDPRRRNEALIARQAHTKPTDDGTQGSTQQRMEERVPDEPLGRTHRVIIDSCATSTKSTASRDEVEVSR